MKSERDFAVWGVITSLTGVHRHHKLEEIPNVGIALLRYFAGLC